MNLVISHLIAAIAAFGFLFAVPLTLAAGFALFETAPRGRDREAPRSLVLDNAKFAAAWSLFGYLPGAWLVAASGDQGLAFLTVAAALAAAAFAHALFRGGAAEEGRSSRNLWAGLESLLVVLGFLVFAAVQGATAGLVVA